MENVIAIHDYGDDSDDEIATILEAYLHHRGLICLKAVVGNLQPALLRARIGKGTYQQLGLPGIPVGVGLRVNESVKTFPDENDIPYVAREDEVVQNGQALLLDTLRQPDCGKAVLSLNSGLTDTWALLCADEQLFKQKVGLVSIMGGVETEGDQVKLTDGFMTPNTAANNMFDWQSAIKLYRRLQELQIPMVVVTREVARNCKFGFDTLGEMARKPNPIGRCLLQRQMSMMQKLFEKACAPVGSSLREGLPSRCDRAWFVEDFCGGENPAIPDGGDVKPYLKTFNLYDPTNIVASVSMLRNRFYNPTIVSVNGVDQLVIGVSFKNHGIKDPVALKSFMEEAILASLE